MKTLISLAAADFNGDGTLDLALSAATGMNRTSPRVMVLLGNGDGTFQPPSLTSCTWGSIEVADFDGDGISDVLVWSDTRGSVRLSVLAGNGDGTLRPPRNAVLNGFGQFAAIWCVAGDFDGDGKSDLAFSASSPGQLTVLMATGGGGFRVGAGLTAPSTVSLYPIGSGDFNADGRLDLIVGRGTGTSMDLHVIFGSGDGNFPKAVYYPLAGVSSILSMAALDYDRDGYNDLVLLGYSPDRVAHLFTHFGNGDGTFRLAGDTNTGFADGSGFAPRFMMADLNGDGTPDAAAGGSGFVSVFSGAADGSFSGTPSVAVGGQPSSVVIADFDSDGMKDLAYLSGSGVSLMKGNGDGSFQAGVEIAPSSPGADTREGANAGVLAAADLDGDGRLDLVNANATTVSTILGKGRWHIREPHSVQCRGRGILPQCPCGG